ncbi:MAG: hypothetical protein ACK5QQ_00050, partial [Cyanobacteriota bacterium]
GNMGIGTDNLGAKLHIAHTNQDPGGGALILGPISQSNLRLGYNQGYSWIQSHGSKPLSINAIGNNVGIGTVNPGNKLTIQGNFNESKDPEGGIANGGLLALKGNAPQIDFIDTEHGDWSIHVNEGRMYFIREPWEHQDLVLDGKGNIGIGSSVPQAKLNIRELTGTPATALKGTLLLDHEDAGGASSIVFSSRVNRGSDYAFIEFRDKNPSINDIEAALLTIGMQNDINDHIALMPSGNVGIGTTTPGAKLTVSGANNASKDPESGITAGGQLAIKGNAPQIDFIDIDHNDWSIHVNSNKMYFIRQPWEHSDLVLDGAGKIGIGTSEPQAKLQIVHTNQEPNGGALILGPTDQSNLRLGYNQNYSWIQSHGNKPLSINSISNRVGIGTDNPSGSLHVVIKDSSGIFFEFPGKGTWVFQSDGNLVKYRANGSVAWALNNGW